jgi:hypothetical protein
MIGAMGRTTLLLVLALLRGAGEASAARGPVGVVGFQGGRPGAVARLSARTLQPAARPVPLRGYVWGSALAPGGGDVAVGVAGGSRVRLAGARLQLVDLRHSRTRALLRLTQHDGAATVLAWPTRRRVLALVGARVDARVSLVVIDPMARRVLRRAALDGDVLEAVARPSGLVALVAPRAAIGPVALVMIGPSGRRRTVPLGGIAGGTRPGGEFRQPGLAADPAGRRAWVLAADASSVAEVDLARGAVATHPVVASAAKEEHGSLRSALWLPSGLLAVSGYDVGLPAPSPRGPESPLTPFGLHLLDPRDWTLRVVDPAAEFTAVGPGGLLVSAAGLQVYDVFGRPGPRFPALKAIIRMTVGERYAYVSVQRPRHRTYVIDLRTGATVARLPTAQPAILLAS